MHLSKEEERRIAEILEPYRKNERIQSLKNYTHHKGITTYDHCTHVTEMCCRMNAKLRLRADEKVLIVAAFLHDFYLYDWHEKHAGHGLHGYTHPTVACENAVETFGIGEREQAAIRTHMWPLTLRSVPASREAWILTLADKICSVAEIVGGRLRKRKE